ncbi:MAG: hypothetical protein R6U78_04620 [Bacteroidales bacterium]
MMSIQGQQHMENPKIEVGFGITDFNRFLKYNEVYGSYQLSAYYRISNSVNVGIQGAYAGIKLFNYAGGNNTFGGHIVSYNLAGKVYLTSFLSNKDDRKLHVYAKGKAGALTYIPVSEEVFVDGTYFDYGAYLGIVYTPFLRIGAFLELGYGKNTFSQFGILFHF